VFDIDDKGGGHGCGLWVDSECNVLYAPERDNVIRVWRAAAASDGENGDGTIVVPGEGSGDADAGYIDLPTCGVVQGICVAEQGRPRLVVTTTGPDLILIFELSTGAIKSARKR
jgi:hypothetical protein